MKQKDGAKIKQLYIMNAKIKNTEILKNATKLLHQQIEKHVWVKLLFKQKLTIQQYYCFIKLILPIYTALENKDSLLRQYPFFPIEIYRATKLKQDIKLIEENILIKAPTNNPYYDHINQLSTNDPSGWISHFYVRYFGDLSGGLLIQKALLKHDFFKNKSLNFYDFTQFKKKYPEGINFLRKKINEISFNEMQIQILIAEAEKAFYLTENLMNIAVNFE